MQHTQPEDTLIAVRDVEMFYPAQRPVTAVLRAPFAPRGGTPALRGVNLNVQRGDRLALLGPKGAGKTTLLKLMSGLLLPSRGEITVNGRSTRRDDAATRRAVAFVMNEERSFFWRLSGRHNLLFFGALDDYHGRALADRVDEMIAVFRLAPVVDRPFSTYSSGMKQRLAVARGMLPDPDVLILDEPTRALDPVACDELIGLILEELHARAGKTLLIATHRFDEVARLCDTVAVVNRGRIAARDSLADLAARGTDLPRYYRDSLEEADDD